VIGCGRYLPGENSECAWAADPREAGLALGAN
jgi:gamma-glutamyltranspeptidase / glutathione hydrolase